jgi:hypothetical protein
MGEAHFFACFCGVGSTSIGETHFLSLRSARCFRDHAVPSEGSHRRSCLSGYVAHCQTLLGAGLGGHDLSPVRGRNFRPHLWPSQRLSHGGKTSSVGFCIHVADTGAAITKVEQRSVGTFASACMTASISRRLHGERRSGPTVAGGQDRRPIAARVLKNSVGCTGTVPVQAFRPRPRRVRKFAGPY